MTGFFENLLTGIYSFVGNYGWAVILFSLLIKAVLLPLDFKSRRSMRAMSALTPKMEELKKRYANDQEKLNQKMGELYRKNKVNPLSGCLPMLLQLPILFIMFAAMRNIAAELQLQQMFNWVSDNFVDKNAWAVLTQTRGEWEALRNILSRGLELTAGQQEFVTAFLNSGYEGASSIIDGLKNGTLSEATWTQLLFNAEEWSRIRGIILAGKELTVEDMAFVNVFLKSDDATVISFIEGLKNGLGAEVFTENSWLWVKNVFQPDSFSKTTVLTQSELTAMLTQYSKKISDKDMLALLRLYSGYGVNEIAAGVDAAISAQCGYKTINLFFNMLPVRIPTNWSVYVNGWLILPVLAGLTQFIQTKLTPAAESANNQNGSGKFMKWFFPIFSVWICLSSTAAFAAYWVFVNIWAIITNFIINKIIDKKTPAVSETEKEAIQP